MLTPAEVVLNPRLSVAIAVSVCAPAATLARVTPKGAAVAVPTSVAPSKKSTLTTLPSVSAAVAVTEMLAGAAKTALLAGAVMLTAGSRSTRMLTAAEVVLNPRLSVARTVSVCAPAATLARVTVKGAAGAAVAVPTSVAPSKKSTLATVPSASLAVAFTVMLAGAVKTALLAGPVIVTVGGTSTIILTAAEVVLAPRLSVARATSVCVPAATLTRVTPKGAAVAVPTSVAPSKKSTFATVPSLSVAFAVTETLAGVAMTALFAGEVMPTVGSAST